MIRVYTAGPYRAKSLLGIARNIYRAWKVAKALWALGFSVICPHLNTLFMSEGRKPLPAQVFLDGDLDLVKVSDVVLMLPGWQLSTGSLGEKDFALRNGIPVVYDIEELLNKRKELNWRRV